MASASDLEKGSYFLINDEPVCVTRKEVVAFGTHSHSKLKIFYKSVDGGGEKSATFMHGSKVEVLDIIRKVGQVISKSNDKVQIMDVKSYETFEAQVPAEIFDHIDENDGVIYIEFRGSYRILEKK